MFNKMNTNINISFNDVKTTIKIFDYTMYYQILKSGIDQTISLSIYSMPYNHILISVI